VAFECKVCGSTDFSNNGISVKADGTRLQKVKCKSCGRHGSYPIEETRASKNQEIHRKFVASPEEFMAKSVYVITCAQNDSEVDSAFLESLKSYVAKRDAQLAVIPVRYTNPSAYKRPTANTWDSRLIPFMVDTKLEFPEFKILGDLKVQPTMQSPLNGLDPVTQGKTTIVGHAQIQLKSLPRLRGDSPILLTTTGSVTKKNFSDSRAGYIAEFHHSIGAVVAEQDESGFVHIRHLVADEDGSFIDIGVLYKPDGNTEQASTKALVLGDEHAVEHSINVLDGTFCGDGIVPTLRPEILVRHDVFDSKCISHHNEGKFFDQFITANFYPKLKGELVLTLQFLIDTTPEYSKSVVVGSNHNSHLTRWLQEDRSGRDITNARIHSKLKALMIQQIDEDNASGVIPRVPDAFVLFAKDYLKENKTNKTIEFLEPDESLTIAGIEVSLHGDKGPNGSRGSAKGLSRLPHKTVIGHSHTPGIERGCYQVGTSTGFDLSYCSGPTSWMNTHCAIYQNGKRQLIHIVGTKWRRK